jgi:hypothetical protein
MDEAKIDVFRIKGFTQALIAKDGGAAVRSGFKWQTS